MYYSQHWLCTCQLDSVIPRLAQVRAYSSMAWHTHSSPVLQWQASDSHTDTNAAASTRRAQRRYSAELLMASQRDIWSWNTRIHSQRHLYDKAHRMLFLFCMRASDFSWFSGAVAALRRWQDTFTGFIGSFHGPGVCKVIWIICQKTWTHTFLNLWISWSYILYIYIYIELFYYYLHCKLYLFLI